MNLEVKMHFLALIAIAVQDDTAEIIKFIKQCEVGQRRLVVSLRPRPCNEFKINVLNIRQNV